MTATEPHGAVDAPGALRDAARHAGKRHAGHTRVGTQALASTARAVAAHVFGVPPANVRVVLNDEFGSLALGLSLPLPIDGLEPFPTTASGPSAPRAGRPPVWERARDSRAAIRDRFTQLTGAHVSRVDVRVTGIVPEKSRRVV